jgi:hypothetical protein
VRLLSLEVLGVAAPFLVIRVKMAAWDSVRVTCA